MKLTLTKEKNKLLKSIYKYYKEYYSFNKIILVLENEYEFLDLWQTQRFFLRKKIKGYDIDDIDDIQKKDINFIKQKIIPVIYGYNYNYLGNKSIAFFEIFNKLPHNSNIGIIKIIGPGEINNNNLYAYENIEYIFNKILNTKTESFFYYTDWNTNIKYVKLISKYSATIFNSTIDNLDNLDNKKKNIYIGNFDYFTKDNKLNELSSFPGRLLFLIYGLNLLETNGNLYIEYYDISYKFNVQLLYLIRTYFKNYEFIKPNTRFLSLNGIYLFKEYIGKHKLLSILKQYLKYDNTLGKKFLRKSSLEYNTYFTLNIKIDDHFFSFIKKINDNHILGLKKQIKKCNFIKSQIKENKYFINKLLDNNIEIAIQYCKKYNLKINPYYKNHFYKLDSFNLKKKLFPKANIDYNKLKLNYIATYSITYPEEAEIISQIIKKKYPNVNTIADMTANVGGNTISFCRNFKYVYAIEIDKNTSELLKNNLQVYGFKNYEVLNIDSINFNRKVDFYFFDPPWTGILYKMNINMDLYLGNINIIDILPPNFCLKAPINYNISSLVSKFKNISIYNLKNYIIIINNKN